MEDIKLVQKLKSMVKDIPDLVMPLETDYLIVETDGSLQGWGVALKANNNKYSNKNEERICAY